MNNVEAIADAAVSYLRASLPAAIAAVNAAGGVPLAVPDVVEGYTVGGVIPRPPVFPAVEVSPSDDDILQISIGQRTTRGEVQVYVVVWVEDPDYQTLVRRCYRYGRAVGSCLLQAGAWGPGAVPRRARAAYRTEDPDARDDRTATRVLLGFAMLQFTLEVAADTQIG